MSESNDTPWHMKPALRVFFAGCVGLLMGGLLAVWVRYDATVDMARSEALRSTQVDDLQSALETTEDRLDSETARGTVQEARIALARALTELDQGNFGKTQDLIRHSATLLRDVSPSDTDIDPAVLATVIADLEQFVVRISANPISQRTALVTLADQLDHLLERS